MSMYRLNYGAWCSLSEAEVAHFKHPKRKTTAFLDKRDDEKTVL